MRAVQVGVIWAVAFACGMLWEKSDKSWPLLVVIFCVGWVTAFLTELGAQIWNRRRTV